MSALEKPATIGELPAQSARAPANASQSRARFFNSGNAFNIKLSDVPNGVFSDEPAKALADDAPTGFVNCDASGALGCAFPATSPLILAQYARINAGDELIGEHIAGGVIHYVIQGSGRTTSGDETVTWARGDVFVTPGGVSAQHHAETNAVLWVVTNEPLFRFEGARAPVPQAAPTGLVHYTSDEISRQIDLLYDIGGDTETAGMALIMSSEQQMAARNVLPSLTLAMNTLEPGTFQRAHRHNSVAVSLVVQGAGCYSMIDGERKDWSSWATTITPPTSVHSHHNDGPDRALFLIVQDGGLYYHARAMGFEFVGD